MKVSWTAAIACGAIWLVGCLAVTETAEDEITVIGSDTMLELDRRLAEGFMRTNPGDTVRVEGGGSGAGIEALIDGRADIAAASRPLAALEVSALHEHFGTLGVRYLIAQDALSIYVNQRNPVRDLSIEQLRGLFDGSFLEWSLVGGGASEVVVVVRPPSSGTHRFFRDHVLGGAPYSPRAVAMPTTRGVLAAVQGEAGAIGYGGLAFRLDGVKQLSIEGVAPTREAVGQGRYPLARYLAFFTTRPATGLSGRFIDWCVSADGQRVVAEVGYVPLWKS
jgi:phosphate transport system substrate-binding protein